MKIGFDNDKYLQEQSEEIRRRAGKYGKRAAHQAGSPPRASSRMVSRQNLGSARGRSAAVLGDRAPRRVGGRSSSGSPARRVGEGAADAGLFLVKRGAVRVTVRRGARDAALALLTPHDFFGDLAGTRSRTRTATVTAVSETELLQLPAADLLGLLAQRPELAAALEEIQLERLARNAATLRAPS